MYSVTPKHEVMRLFLSFAPLDAFNQRVAFHSHLGPNATTGKHLDRFLRPSVLHKSDLCPLPSRRYATNTK